MQNLTFCHIWGMKRCFFTVCAGTLLFLAACGETSLANSRYYARLPALPQAWIDLLGSPQWRFEWQDDDGRKKAAVAGNSSCGSNGSGSFEISLPQTWASAVLAFPYWPEKGIGPGVFRPAGAIFPFDADGKYLVMSWQGGVDAVLYRELARACGGAGQDDARAAVPRFPQNFNWPRFRQLFSDSTVNADVRADPWLADWQGIAEKIVQSGFDKRRLVPEARSSLRVSVGPGPWTGTSPFALPLYFETDPVFPVRRAADTWISGEGILRCSTGAWMLKAFTHD